jgi:hypothetical protein
MKYQSVEVIGVEELLAQLLFQVVGAFWNLIQWNLQ